MWAIARLAGYRGAECASMRRVEYLTIGAEVLLRGDGTVSEKCLGSPIDASPFETSRIYIGERGLWAILDLVNAGVNGARAIYRAGKSRGRWKGGE